MTDLNSIQSSSKKIEVYLDFLCDFESQSEIEFIRLLNDVCFLAGRVPEFHANRQLDSNRELKCNYICDSECDFSARDMDFLVVSSIASLSYPILNSIDLVWMRIQKLDFSLHKSLYLRAMRSSTQRLYFDISKIDLYQPRCSILTSVYDGDIYIDNFLENSRQLVDYDKFEHFIVLPDSPGNEFKQILEHTSQHKNVIFLRLQKDPGLYAVWNIAIKLSHSPYLTNANIDDFRASDHIKKLITELDKFPEAVAAASALYITDQPNQVFSPNLNLPIWYESSEPELVPGNKLIKMLDNQVIAHNFLHCMPVWRSSLHFYYGYFDETSAGPSADWEFWMRCASRNSKFIRQGEPLGVHYKAPESYWRRKTKGTEQDYTASILARYVDSHSQLKMCEQTTRAYQLVEKLVSNLKSPLRLIDVIHQCSNQHNRHLRIGENFSLAVNYILKKQFALANKSNKDIETFESDKNYLCKERVYLLIDLLAQLLTEMEVIKAEEQQLDGYWSSIFELQRLGYETESFLLASRMSRLLSNHDQESLLLKRSYESNSELFWGLINRIYRFTKSLPDVFKNMGISEQYFNPKTFNQTQPIYYFPDYSKGNPYQRELYRSSIEAGCSVIGINTYNELVELVHKKESGLLHIHWLNAIFDKVTESELDARSESFLQIINELKTRGWKVFWTVHNKYSHSNMFKSVERRLRNQLSDLADKVLLHHPAAVPILKDWISESAHIEFQEHGPYPTNILSTQESQRVRAQLGIEHNELVLGFFGKIKPYKALDKLLSQLLPLVEFGTRFKLIIAGQQMCDKSKKIIALFPKHLTVIDNDFITNDALSEYYSATDFVVLSYEDILTSGSLFQSFSYAKPVIAPSLGTIPPFVIDGFNGFIYKESSDLKYIFSQLQNLNSHNLKLFSQNALQSAQIIQWPK